MIAPQGGFLQKNLLFMAFGGLDLHGSLKDPRIGLTEKRVKLSTEELKVSLVSVIEKYTPLKKFSSMAKLVRVVAWMIRFMNNTVLEIVCWSKTLQFISTFYDIHDFCGSLFCVYN